MKPFMSGFNSHGYALLRIVTGFLFLWHGSQKLLGFPGPPPMAVLRGSSLTSQAP